MVELGKFNKLKIARKGSPGYFLDVESGNTSDDILLPFGSCLDQELEENEIVDTFIYRDSKDRLIATLKKPTIQVGEVGYLEVKSDTRIGAFVDIGLERDLFVPLKEQTHTLIEGEKYLFYMYVDKTNRLAGTTKVEPYLEISEEYKVSDEVNAIVYDFYKSENVAMAVEGKYKAIMLKNEYFTRVKIGENLKLNVKKIYEDGTLGLTPREKAGKERSKLQDQILKYLDANDGFMPFNDKSSPEAIKEVFHESKNYFKRALGGLMKKGLIKQDEKGTNKVK